MSENIQTNIRLNKAFKNYVFAATNEHMNYVVGHILYCLTKMSINLGLVWIKNVCYLNELLNKHQTYQNYFSLALF